MELKPAKSARNVMLLGAIMSVVAILLQFYLILEHRTVSVLSTMIRFFSFFTILTNILVALCFIFLLSGPSSHWGKFFANNIHITAIAVNITIVGLTYNIILRGLWAPKGLDQVADELLHTVIPIYFIIFWIIFIPKRGFSWKSVFPWLIYPTVYAVYILVRGAFISHYPYPFVDVEKLGYPQVLLNCLFTMFGFLVVSLVFVSIAKSMDKK
jgi:hypothetical protein